MITALGFQSNLVVFYGSTDVALSTNGVSSSPLAGDGHYEVSFPSNSFCQVPIVTVTGFQSGTGNARIANLQGVSAAVFELFIRNNNDVRKNGTFSFIAIGER